MRKTQIALAAVALVASSAALAAEVKISGVLDIGVGRTSGNGGTGGVFIENGAYTDHSGIDLNVSEDLDGGMKAYGSLGMGFNPNGQSDNPGNAMTYSTAANPDLNYRNNSLFNRQTYVGLSGDFGSIQLGRQLSPFIISIASSTLYNGMFGVSRMWLHGGAGVAGGDGGGFFRDNIVQYTTPSISGFTGTVFYQTPNGTRNNNFLNDLGQYSAYSLSGPIGPIKFTTAYQKQNFSSQSGLQANEYNGWVIGGVMPISDQVDIALGYITTRTGLPGTPSQDSWNVGLGYALTGSAKVTLQHASRNSDANGVGANVSNIMVSNALSKRTTLYAGYGRGDGVGATIGTWGGTRDTNGAAVAGNNIERRDGVQTNNSAIVFGVNHTF